MVTISLWHIKGKLKNLIDYVQNPEKPSPIKICRDFFDMFSYVNNP